MSQRETTHYCQYGPQGNVRASYAHLPFQPLWTWLTGKGQAQDTDTLKARMERTGERFLQVHLLLTWATMIGLVLLGKAVLDGAFNPLLSVLLVLAAWVLMVNRLRSMQATFHYLTHGAVLKDKARAQRYARFFLTTPLLYQDWDTYNQSHVREHHNIHVLCTDIDPDQCFIQAQGFHPGMAEPTYWWRVISTPFRPTYLLRQWRGTLNDCFVRPPREEVRLRLVFWGALLALLWASDCLAAFGLIYVIPRAVLFEHSMWLQLFTEHLWFYQRESGRGDKPHYGRLTWGRFQGRRPPRGGLAAWAAWLLKGLLLDVPVRLYVYPQDLPNHDAHHRRPNVHYRHIADYRASIEQQPSSYGPFLEVWGFMAGLYLIRDHMCRGVREPFGPLQAAADEPNDTLYPLADSQGA
ncbi:hypothetical protein V0R50_27815 [Pseudomonas sp. 148P]|uniref:Fatty acid desaturase domain-containing protein n=1 Tax=Pseudomonas ulcerans TaxID=3115852 RepID=A0ABU7I037_9PSED|nr:MULTISPECIES: hypothetical protein [unclassified Pseudomonas]MEE1925753.1 hypothetical protein [Pseudomonas sp. 147P]MEE1937048.1 hypothetical protein [Pseudomonas sp. 148P]